MKNEAVKIYPFYDSDLGTVIAVATQPLSGKQRLVFKRYQLYKVPLTPGEVVDGLVAKARQSNKKRTLLRKKNELIA